MAKKVSKKIDTVTVPVGIPVRKGTRWGDDAIRYEDKVNVNIDGHDLDDIIERLTKLKEEYSAEYTGLKIEEIEESYEYESGSYKYLQLWGTRKISEVELEVFAETEARRQAENERRELAEFERLQKKFGKKG